MRRVLRLGGLCVALLAGLCLAPALAGPVAEVTVQDNAAAPSKVFAFGGGVWRVPKVQRLAEPLLTELGEGGTWRVALAWEVLAAADRPEDITRLLNAYPLNDFLRARAKAGGQIIVTLDAMPRFLARETSGKKLADGPLWAHSATDDLQGWADVSERVARHFHDLGITPIYEVWNEPDHSLRGSLEDYMQLYRATALGVLRADPAAKIAGPALSDWGATIDGARFISGFLTRAAEMPLPELGLRRLPVDAITYHAFNRVPGRHHARVMAEARNLLTQAGYSAVPVICSEWNIAAEPPYPEGDLNGTYPGAAHALATMIAMANAGTGAQVFQMAVDPGASGYAAGVLTPAGTPHPVWHAFDMMAEASRVGERQETTSSDPVVEAAAFYKGGKLAILIAVFPPTDLMLARDAMEPVAFADPALFAEISVAKPKALAGYMFKDARPPSGLSAAAVAALAAGRETLRGDQVQREPWRKGGTVRLQLTAKMRLISDRVVDDRTAISPDQLAAADKSTNSLLRDLLGKTERALRSKMTPDTQDEIRRYGDALAARLDGRAELSAGLTEIDQAWVQPAQAHLLELLDQQNKRLVQPIADDGAKTSFDIGVRPYSAHLLIFEQASP